MNRDQLSENPYILLTPGPLSTSPAVKATMLRDWCTWDSEYNAIVQDIRSKLVGLATGSPGYTAVLMQGSGTFAVEATLGTAVPENGKLLIIANGHYGDRMGLIARYMKMPHHMLDFGEVGRPVPQEVQAVLENDPGISHVAVVHCETTTGMLNPVQDIGRIVKSMGKVYIVDAMSSFGGIPMDAAEIGADFIISSSNKCIQGVPGFGFVVARRDELEKCAGRSRSLSLDLYDQWREMELKQGRWRFTSPTHTVRAFAQAMSELEMEGGVGKRHARYCENHRTLVDGMTTLGFHCLLPQEWQSPIITSFLNPTHPAYDFQHFYRLLKNRGFVIYPGKVTTMDTFRIGNIGAVFPDDMKRFVAAVRESMYWTV